MYDSIRKLTLIKSLDELSAPELAKIIKFLIKHEIKPGGPYKLNSRDDVWLNNHIYNLFAAKGKILNSSMRISESASSRNKYKKDSSSKHLFKNQNLYEIVSLHIHSYLNKSDLVEFDKILNKVKAVDTEGEISNLSVEFYESLKQHYYDLLKISKSKKSEYSLANIYTWITYSIIDSLLDTEYKARLLPIVAMLQRKIVHHYLRAGVKFELIESLFNEVDSANITELRIRKNIEVDIDKDILVIHSMSNNRTKRLASQKSIAHCIGPITIASVVNPSNSYKIKNALELYCEARQLNDDLHDWEDDLANGEMTYVIYELFKASSIGVGRHQYSDIIEQLKEAYWSETLTKLCKLIEADIAESKKVLENNILKKDSQFVSMFLTPISDSAKMANKRHLYDKEFLESMADI